MKTLKIVTVQKQPIAEVTWEYPDKVTSKVFDPKSEIDLEAILTRATKNGLPYRLGGVVEENGKQVMVDRQIMVGPDHEKFLDALSNIVSQLKFSGQRVFGLVQQQ